MVRTKIHQTPERETDSEICGEATDGVEAVAGAKELTPDLILLDVKMPRLNRLEVAGILRHTQPGIRIMMVITHNEGSGLAIVPRHQVSLRHLTRPHFWAKRRSDNAVRSVYMGIAALGVDLLNPRASPQRSGRLQCVGVYGGHH
jgi:CheY-like chemotaxis protein